MSEQSAPTTAYNGEPAFFVRDGVGVSIEYVTMLRDVLGIPRGVSLLDAVTRLRAESACLRTALTFYATQENWRRPESVESEPGRWMHFGSPAEADGGDCARSALASSPTEETGA